MSSSTTGRTRTGFNYEDYKEFKKKCSNPKQLLNPSHIYYNMSPKALAFDMSLIGNSFKEYEKEKPEMFQNVGVKLK